MARPSRSRPGDSTFMMSAGAHATCATGIYSRWQIEMAVGRKTGGRQKGTPNKATVERELRAAQGLKAATLDGLLPLDVMMCRMKNEALPNGSSVADDQLAAAIAAAPYIHPKLAAAVFKGEASGADGGPVPHALALNYDNLSVDDLMTRRRRIDKAAGESAEELDATTAGLSPAGRRRLD
jgi:hypothetical protein